MMNRLQINKLINALHRTKCFLKVLKFKFQMTGFNKNAFETAYAVATSSYVRVKSVNRSW